MKYKTILASGVVVAFLGAAVCAHAQNLNGTVNNAFYGSPLAVQTINTGFGDAAGGADSAGGSELDAAYGKISGGNLYLFLAGNVEANGNHLNVFIAGGAAGQSILAAPTANVMGPAMNGSVFSPGFQATFALDVNDYSPTPGTILGTLYSEEYNLTGVPSGGYVGALGESSLGIAAGSDGGVSSLYLNNNHASSMGAAGAAYNGGASVTTGYELVIPLSAIGYTGGSINVLADVNGGGDSFLSNQFLPGLAVGTGNVGGGGSYTGPSSGAFNFANTPGEYFTVVPEPSSMVLLGLSGLTTLLAIRRRK
jgi:hypothetical protein